MSLLRTITRSNFVIKLKAWEYWPFGIIQFPSILYYLWLSIRSRSLVFFSASNPGIEMGGMFGESKFKVLKMIPAQFIPTTILIEIPATKEMVLKQIVDGGLKFPLIFKPDLGERGFMVKRIDSEGEIDEYLKKIKVNFLAQEQVDFPHEFGIFYRRFPNEITGSVTSVVMKEMLSVTGDGRSTLQEMILQKDRAKLQWPKLQKIYRAQLNMVIPVGKSMELISIGNHALGTKFLNGNSLINEKLSLVFDTISKEIPGFYFGRYDLRTATIEDLYSGRLKIMELNGCGAEPGHIYDPGFSIWKAIGVLVIHWSNIFEIARQNRRNGVPYTPLREAYDLYKKFKAATQ